MSFNKLLRWLTTESGQRFSFVVAVSATTSSFLAYYLPNTLLLDKYESITALYKSGFPVPLTPILNERFQKALNYCDVPEEDKGMYKPYHVTGFDVFSAGSWYSRFGSIIGIPINFNYKNMEDIDKSGIKVGGETVVWSLPEGQQLFQSLILSEDAQIYAMCKEIKMCESPKLVIQMFSATICTAATYSLAQGINNKLQLLARPLGLRLTLYTLITLFTLGNYIFAKDSCQVYYEMKIDKELKAKDPKLTKGAVEYYDQILKRNVALRKMLGKAGESLYSILGNENYLIRQKHLPLVQRRDFFKHNVEFS